MNSRNYNFNWFKLNYRKIFILSKCYMYESTKVSCKIYHFQDPVTWPFKTLILHTRLWKSYTLPWLACQHFSAEELLLNPRRRRPRRHRRPCDIQNVRANVKMLEFQSFCICLLLLNFAYHTNKVPYNKTLWQARIWWLWHLWFLARLHFSAEELLLYPQRRRPQGKC